MSVETKAEREMRITNMKRRRALPPLPINHAPWHPEWSNNMAICTIMRQENVTDVREWLDYYRCAINLRLL
jgi:hypothetical protein